jgi:preprotein translocase subunit SecA
MMRIEVRFQAPEPPPAMQFQHLDPVTGANEVELGAISEPINAAYSPSTSAIEETMVADRNPGDPKTWGRIGRNEPCPCGSGKKFKHCHGVLV